MKKIVTSVLIMLFCCITFSVSAADENWALKSIGYDYAKEILNDAKYDVRVAVIDSGVDFSSPILKNKVVYYYNAFTDYECKKINHEEHNHTAKSTHGTEVASLITGKYGISSKARIMSLVAFDQKNKATEYSIAACIYKAIENECDIINISYGDYNFDDSSKSLIEAVNYAYSLGIPVIASAGNNGEDIETMPAKIHSVITVSAYDKNKKLCDFSNYGWNIDISAPGKDIITHNGKKEVLVSGTDYSAAIVTGVFSYVKSFSDIISFSDLQNIILTNADRSILKKPEDIKNYGIGALDFKKLAESISTNKTANKNQLITSFKAENKTLFAITNEEIKFNFTLSKPISQTSVLQAKIKSKNGYTLCQTPYLFASELKQYNDNSKIYFAKIDLNSDKKSGTVTVRYDYFNLYQTIGEDLTENTTCELYLSDGTDTNIVSENFKILSPIKSSDISASLFIKDKDKFLDLSFDAEREIESFFSKTKNKYLNTFVKISAVNFSDFENYTLKTQKINSATPIKKDENKYKLDISSLPVGVYYLEISFEANTENGKPITMMSYTYDIFAVKKALDISLESSAGGTVSMNAIYDKQKNREAYIFKPIAYKGYKLINLKCNGKIVNLTDGTYKITNPSENIKIFAEFKKCEG